MMRVGVMQSDDPTASDTALRPQLSPVLAPFRLHTGELTLRTMNIDDSGDRSFRYAQTFNGLPVIGGDLRTKQTASCGSWLPAPTGVK